MPINPLVNKLICPGNGSATDLGIAFGGGLINDSGTGFFSDTAGEIGIAVAGVEVFRFTSSGGSEVGELFLADGTAAAPSLAWKGTSANTGLYLFGTDSIGFSSNGVTSGNVSSAGVWKLNGGLNIGVGSNNAANVVNIIGAPSAALSGVGQSGYNCDQIFNTSGATTSIHAYRSALSTLAAAYTCTEVTAFRAADPTIGAGSTATRVIGAYLDMPTGGTNNCVLSDNKVFTGNFGINLATTNASSLAGALTVAGQLIGKGTATNDSAAAGVIGEVLSASRLASAAASATTTTSLNVTASALSLTAGDWDVSGVIVFIPAATTSVTLLKASISKTTATLSGADTMGVPTSGEVLMQVSTAANVATATICVPLPTTRISLAGTTSIFLVANATFSVSTLTVAGSINARRVR